MSTAVHLSAAVTHTKRGDFILLPLLFTTLLLHLCLPLLLPQLYLSAKVRQEVIYIYEIYIYTYILIQCVEKREMNK